ncbi:TPA: hypothetical protein ACHLGH_004926, partial [Escherichia coli]|nr:hypothetical protein [Escherichia coli]
MGTGSDTGAFFPGELRQPGQGATAVPFKFELSQLVEMRISDEWGGVMADLKDLSRQLLGVQKQVRFATARAITATVRKIEAAE